MLYHKKILKNNISELHIATRFSFIICRCIGVLPLEGIMGKSVENLRFNLKSMYTTLIAATYFLMIILLCFVINHVTKTGLDYINLSYLIYICEGIMRVTILFWISKHWPELITNTLYIESLLPSIRENTTKFRYKVVGITSLLFVGRLVLYHVFEDKLLFLCNNDVSRLEAFYEYNMPFVFKYIDYDPFIAYVLLIPIYQNFVMQYQFDIVVAFISAYLTQYFIEFNKRIVSSQNKIDLPWKHIRIQYTKMMSLVTLIDCKISYMIVISLGSNLIAICTLIFHLLKNGHLIDVSRCNISSSNMSNLKVIYFAYLCCSLVFVVARTLIMTLSAAKLNLTSEEPAMFIYEIPDYMRCHELQRLLKQINTSIVALTGVGFFNVTREMILSMTGVIITYELVLLQFARNGGDNDQAEFENNTSTTLEL